MHSKILFVWEIGKMGEIRGEQEMGEGVEIWNLGEWKMDENRILEGKDLRLELPLELELAQYRLLLAIL
jgi:hypothetical protein